MLDVMIGILYEVCGALPPTTKGIAECPCKIGCGNNQKYFICEYSMLNEPATVEDAEFDVRRILVFSLIKMCHK